MFYVKQIPRGQPHLEQVVFWKLLNLQEWEEGRHKDIAIVAAATFSEPWTHHGGRGPIRSRG